jgi:hypothetical protein
MVDAAIMKQSGAAVGACLTVDHPSGEVGLRFVMLGPDGHSHPLLASDTNQERFAPVSDRRSD